jgi:hypothetical protein
MEKKFYVVGTVSEYNDIWLYSRTEGRYLYCDSGQQIFHLTEDQAKDSLENGEGQYGEDKIYEVIIKELP